MRQALRFAGVGLIGLASAMGIGRFAFTPILPLMQASDGLTLVQGGWLASVNYLGYFLGALACIWLTPQPARWARWGLLTVALVTLAMALPAQPFVLWMLWRLLAGVASAFVLVGLSAWCLGQLVQLNASRWAGLVYAGVGVGVMFAGLAGLLAGITRVEPRWLWGALGVVALLVWRVARRDLLTEDASVQRAHAAAFSFNADHGRLILCYGIFGVGYILPATFLPAMARAVLPNPAVFGWVWPVFGVAAALSTLLAARFLHHLSPRRVWAVAALVLALGVALPVVGGGLPSLLLAALCVGGTFMVITMAGMQEAKAHGGATLIAAMTASFAAGQMLGPLLLDLTAGSLRWPSLLAALLLVVSVVLLWGRSPVTEQ